MLSSIRRKLEVIKLLRTKRKLAPAERVQKRIVDGLLQGYHIWYDQDTDNSYVLGNYEQDVIERLQNLIKPGITIYDCGSHQGYFGMSMSKLTEDDGVVYSFEALPSNFKTYKKNLELNNVKNVKAFHVAIGNQTGTVQFSNSGNSVANTLMKSSSVFSDYEKIDVPISTLDAFQVTHKLKLPNLVKMDIEGAEYEALLGMNRILVTAYPDLHIATHDVHQPGVRLACLRYLNDLGYELIAEVPHQGHKDMSDLILQHKSRK